MSAGAPGAAGRVDATPTPDNGRTGFYAAPDRGEGGRVHTRAGNIRDDADAVRLGVGRLTVDLVATRGGFLAFAGRGVGSPTVAAPAPLATTAGLVAVADTVDARTAWDTAAWPLCARRSAGRLDS